MKLYYRFILACSFVVGCVACSAEIDLKNSQLFPSANSRLGYLEDFTNHQKHQLVWDSPYQKFWISPTIGLSGSRAIGVYFYNYDGCDEKQRAELKIRNSKMNEWIYHAFSIYIHPGSHPLTKDAVFTQIWQQAVHKHPPFSMYLTGADYHFSVVTSKTGSDTTGVTNKIYTSPQALVKGRWYRFVVAFKPSVTQSGVLRVWLNGKLVVGQSNHKNFGYAPQTADPFVNDSFTTRVGLYRGRIACPHRASENLNQMAVLFDDIKYGSSYDEVY
jgi:hypothetical protein